MIDDPFFADDPGCVRPGGHRPQDLFLPPALDTPFAKLEDKSRPAVLITDSNLFLIMAYPVPVVGMAFVTLNKMTGQVTTEIKSMSGSDVSLFYSKVMDSAYIPKPDESLVNSAEEHRVLMELELMGLPIRDLGRDLFSGSQSSTPSVDDLQAMFDKAKGGEDDEGDD